MVERSAELTESDTDEDQSSKEFSKNDFDSLFHPETFLSFFLKIQIKIFKNFHRMFVGFLWTQNSLLAQELTCSETQAWCLGPYEESQVF